MVVGSKHELGDTMFWGRTPVVIVGKTADGVRYLVEYALEPSQRSWVDGAILRPREPDCFTPDERCNDAHRYVKQGRGWYCIRCLSYKDSL